MSNRFFVILLTVIAVIFGLFFVNKSGNGNDSSQDGSGTQPSSHVRGNADGKVTLVEYGDFQCPACGAYYPLLKQLKAKYGDDLVFQFRHFPLSSHINARQAHRSAEAAAKQGKFWEMHDMLYENQQAWSVATDPTNMFIDYASQISLQTEQFVADMKSAEVNDVINADIAAGNDVPVTSTPTFVLNGEKLDPNPGSLEEFERLIEEAINSAGQNDQQTQQ